MNSYAEQLQFMEYQNPPNPNFFVHGNIDNDINRGILLGAAFNDADEAALIQQIKAESIKTVPKDIELSLKYNAWENEEKKLTYTAPTEQNVFIPLEPLEYKRNKKQKEDSINCYVHQKKKVHLVGDKRDPLSLIHICENVCLKNIKYCYKYLLEININELSLPLCYASTTYLMNKYHIDESDIAVAYFRTCHHLKLTFFENTFNELTSYNWTISKSFLIILNDLEENNISKYKYSSMPIFNHTFSREQIAYTINYIYKTNLKKLQGIARDKSLAHYGHIFDKPWFTSMPEEFTESITHIHFNN